MKAEGRRMKESQSAFLHPSSFRLHPSMKSGRLKLARALLAARRLERDGREAVGAVLRGRRGVGRLLALEAVVRLDDEEDHEGDDEEVDYVVDELAVGDDGDALRLRVRE